ncbi:MAG: hypothetical protein JSW39_25570 [Desulfobacterales bacterium]|nr:MAG: hypothetical protein JSW39_25570 [Desulfobacterales bacterium]
MSDETASKNRERNCGPVAHRRISAPYRGAVGCNLVGRDRFDLAAVDHRLTFVISFSRLPSKTLTFCIRIWLAFSAVAGDNGFGASPRCHGHGQGRHQTTEHPVNLFHTAPPIVD